MPSQRWAGETLNRLFVFRDKIILVLVSHHQEPTTANAADAIESNMRALRISVNRFGHFPNEIFPKVIVTAHGGFVNNNARNCYY